MLDVTRLRVLDAAPAEALETARAAADGQDVRIGGVGGDDEGRHLEPADLLA